MNTMMRHDEPLPANLPPEEESSESYRVKLQAFEGPLDLLLHLIRKNEVDIFDIPIFEITRQYNQYLLMMQEFDLEIAADYIYTAALLIHIKSKLLLPKRAEEETGVSEDPRLELVQRLLEYQQFRSAAESLHQIESLRLGVWARPEAEREFLPEKPDEERLIEVSLFDLIDSFRAVLGRYREAHPAGIEVSRPYFSTRQKIVEIWEALENQNPLEMLAFLESMRSRAEMITVFLAMLELIRLHYVRVFQKRLFGEPLLYRIREQLEIEEFGPLDAEDAAEGVTDDRPLFGEVPEEFSRKDGDHE